MRKINKIGLKKSTKLKTLKIRATWNRAWDITFKKIDLKK